MANVAADLVRVTTATTGTGPITLGSAVAGFLSFAGAGVASGKQVTYGISDGTNSEVGLGTYTLSGGVATLSRDTIRASTNAGAAISLDGNAQVFLTISAEDIQSVDTEFADWTPTDASGAGLTFTGVVAQYQVTKNFGFLLLNVTFPATSDSNDVAIGGFPLSVAHGGGGIVTSGPSVPPCVAKTNTSGHIVLFNLTTGAQLTNADMSGKVLGTTLFFSLSS